MSRRPAFDFASPPRDRQQLLAKRITTVEDLRSEVLERWNNKSSVQAFREIPVPLHCGETLQEYSKEFEMWLLQRNETFETLRNDPSRERGFWFSFAHKRAGTCNTVTLRNKVVPRTHDMEELLSHYGPGPSSKRMRRNGCTRDDRASCPEYRAGEGITERSEPASAINSSSNDETERSSLTRSLARPREDHPDRGGDLHCNGSSDWGSSPTFLQPDDRVAASLVHHDDLSSAHTVSPEQPECNADSPPHSTRSISISDEIHDDALQSGAITQGEDTQGEDVSWHDEAESLSPLPRHQKRSKGYLYAADDAVVYDLELAFHCQVSSEEKLRLAQMYDRLDQQIIMSEAAGDNAVACSAEIEECQVRGVQSLELFNSINHAKKKRTAVLAALIVSNWAGRQEGLVSVLEEEFAGGKGAKAEGLATLLEQNEEKAKELKTLEKQRDDQAQLVRSLPPAATGAGRALRFKKLRALSAVLSKKRADKAHLEDEFEKALQSLMQADDKARKLVQDALGTFASS